VKFNSSKPIFEQIAEYYEKLINLGVFSEGDYLPSVRDVALENKVNPNTVAHAFSLLTDKQIVTSIPKKGYQINKINEVEKKKELKKELLMLISTYSLKEIKEVINEFEEEDFK
jgi:DNA-binding transcriptional regulator YhcF (GntR family)